MSRVIPTSTLNLALLLAGTEINAQIIWLNFYDTQKRKCNETMNNIRKSHQPGTDLKSAISRLIIQLMNL